MYNLWFWVIVAILLFNYFLERFLDHLNMRAWNPRLPEPLHGIYDEKEYERSQQYFLANLRFGRLTATFSLLLILVMLFTGAFARLDEWTGRVAPGEVLHTLLFFAVLGLAYDLLTLPFQWYDTFVIEERFGFNRMDKKTFFTDKLKSWFLAALFGGILLGALVGFRQWAGKTFWLWAWGAFSLFSLFITIFYSSLIVPLFNKQTPLEEGPLKQKIRELCARTGFRLDNVYVIDGSRRSSKANAYFSGLGRKKRIVLYDTLLHDLTDEEIVAVLAHELGHYRKHHTHWMLLLSVLETGFLLWMLGLFLSDPAIPQALGGEGNSFRLGLLAYGLLISPVTLLLGLGTGVISRKNEFAADAFAEALGLARPLRNALIKLSEKNLSNLTPHPLYVFFHYSHPPLLQRLAALEKNEGKN